MSEPRKSIFWPRAVAFIIDMGIFFLIGFLIAIFINIITSGAPVTPFEVYIRVLICFSIPFWIYSILSDFSKSGSTIGKKIMKLHVVTLEGKRLRIYQAISRTAIKLIPWELTHLTFFGLSEDWGAINNFRLTQMILIAITYILIFLYIIVMIKMKGSKGIHDLFSRTQLLRRNQS